MDVFLILGIIGMTLILIAFLLNQTGHWTQESFWYDLLNMVGSVLLVIYAYDGRAWPFLILNSVWALYSLKDVAQALFRKRPAVG